MNLQVLHSKLKEMNEKRRADNIAISLNIVAKELDVDKHHVLDMVQSLYELQFVEYIDVGKELIVLTERGMLAHPE